MHQQYSPLSDNTIDPGFVFKGSGEALLVLLQELMSPFYICDMENTLVNMSKETVNWFYYSTNI